VSHDFVENPLYLDFEVTIFNRLSQMPIQFKFSLNKTSGLEFVGFECFRSILKFDEELMIPLQAVIFTSGVYNLQAVMLTIYNDDGTEVPYSFPMQWAVLVNS